MLINQWWKAIKWLAIFMGVVQALATLGYIFVLGNSVQVATQKELGQLVAYIGTAIAIFFVQELGSLFYEWRLAKLLPKYEHKTRGLVLTKWFLIIPKRQVQPGQLYNGLFSDLPQVVSTQIAFVYNAAYGLTLFSLATALLFYLHWIVGLATLGTTLLVIACVLMTGKLAQRPQGELSALRAHYYGASQRINFNKDQFIHMRLLGLYLARLKGEYRVYRAKETRLSLMINALNDVVVGVLSLSVVVPLVVAAVIYGQQNLNYAALVMVLFLGERVVLASVSSVGALSDFIGKRSVRDKYRPRDVQTVQSLVYQSVHPLFANDSAKRKALTLSLQPGSKHLWKGANGTGKSTMLELFDRDINFVGQLIVNGEVVSSDNLARYALARPLKTSAVFASESAIARVFDTKSDTLYQGVRDLIAQHLDLTKEHDHPSQGETQLLSLLHALASAPRILILDEALTSVSKPLRAALYDFLLKQQELTLIVVDHGLDTSWERRFDEVTLFGKKAISHRPISSPN